MNFEEVVEYINYKNTLGSVLGLDNIHELTDRLGNPERKVKVMHIAGTNGKGSIMAYVENVLIEEGFLVGRYISPTIFDYRERFQVNHRYITEEELCEIMTEIKAVCDQIEEETELVPTAFEIETAAAFLYFAKKNVDIMLIECGMGGRLDATNLEYSYALNVLASMSLDHMQFLGGTIAEITREKLGICRNGQKLVIYPSVEEAKNVIDEFVDKMNLELYEFSENDIKVVSEDYLSSRFIYEEEEYEIRMGAGYQILNAVTAINCIKAFNADLQAEGKKTISVDSIKKGLKKTVWAGRFTVLSENPLFIVDGAHNEDAWKQLSINVNKYFTNKKLIYIIGVLKDKAYDKMIEYLSPSMKCAITVTPPNKERALSGKALCDIFAENGIESEFTDGIKSAIELAEKKAAKDDVILCCGTLSFVGEVLRRKGFQEEN